MLLILLSPRSLSLLAKNTKKLLLPFSILCLSTLFCQGKLSSCSFWTGYWVPGLGTSTYKCTRVRVRVLSIFMSTSTSTSTAFTECIRVRLWVLSNVLEYEYEYICIVFFFERCLTFLSAKKSKLIHNRVWIIMPTGQIYMDGLEILSHFVAASISYSGSQNCNSMTDY